MTKVLRLHKGDNTIVDWKNSNAIGSDPIKDIEDPEDGNVNKEITSIPSPFARIDLVKTAFGEVVNNKKFDLDGTIADNKRTTVYHKMVSDSLDVGEIFFNMQKFSDKFQVIYWDKANNLKELMTSANPAHRILGETLEMFFKQDSSANSQKDAQMYNFNKLHRIYMLNYIGPGKPAQMNIVGATSPCTMFFSSANNLEYISKYVSFGQDKPFDSEYRSLYRRDFEYIKYLWAFKIHYENFAIDFKFFDEYLKLTYSMLDYEKKTILDQIDKASIDDYNVIGVGDASNMVEILNYPLHQRPKQDTIDSDFKIATKVYQGKKPLVLPIETGNTYTSLVYTQETWSKNDKAPVCDAIAWKNRRLPDGTVYPYLTISDFLEDTIVRNPYPLNSISYFDGNVLNTEDSSYLLPVTDLFFDFFTPKELMGTVDGKKMIELKENAGGVSVTIRIPISGRGGVKCVEYQRIYFENNILELSSNKGSLREKKFGLGMMPLIEFKENEIPNYRVALFDFGDGTTTLKFYHGNTPVPEKGKVTRREKGVNCSIESYILEKNIDRISVCIDGVNCMILPKLKSLSGTKQFTFSIDFGTTNTHVEYSVDKGPAAAFNVSVEDNQMQRLHKDYRAQRGEFHYGFNDNFIPEQIGNQHPYSFPIRTAFSESKDIDYTKATYSLASGNISFTYEKGGQPNYNDIRTELKWSTQRKDQVELFLDNLFILLRNKVLLNGGCLAETKIVWFYPASMTEAQCNNFNKIWKSLYAKYFGAESSRVISMSESVAPHCYYDKKQGAKRNVVTIDVGGGTTDVYVVENRVPKMLSSFRFASNAIFGDGYNWDSDRNGFVNVFKGEIRKSLKDNELGGLVAVFDSIDQKKISADITAFFFSLANNKEVKDKNVPCLNFLEKLQDHEQLKYVFIIFYTSILYYVANLMKAKGLELPLTIAFSGNGSKTLSVLSCERETLKKYIKLIFETVYNQKYNANDDMDIRFDENPKEATCKGGVLVSEIQSFDDVNLLKTSLLGTDKTTLTDNRLLDGIDSDVINDIVKHTEDFIDFMFDVNNQNDSFFTKKFTADGRIVDEVKAICKQNLVEYTKRGLDARKEYLQSWRAEERVDETLFFLPIVGMLNNLAREISNLKDHDNV